METFFDMLTIVKQKPFLNTTPLANDSSIQHRILGISTRKGQKPKELTEEDKSHLRAGIISLIENLQFLSALPDEELFEREAEPE